MTYHILLTNDDGIDSPGLHAIVAALDELENVKLTIVAPQTQQTSAGRSIQYHSKGTIIKKALSINGKTYQGYAVDASPSQTVMHAVFEILEDKPDLGISGINYGENAGVCITTSGTVGAAIEMVTHGIPSIASSLQLPAESADYFTHDESIDFTVAAHFVKTIVKQVLGKPFPKDVDFFKVEVPFHATMETEWRTTSLSRLNHYEYQIIREGDWSTRGRIDGKPMDYNKTPVEPGTDIETMMLQKKVSVTPLSIDMTSRTSLKEIDKFLKN